MDLNDIRAVVLAYDNIRVGLREAGHTQVDMWELCEAIERVLAECPDMFYLGPNLNTMWRL